MLSCLSMLVSVLAMQTSQPTTVPHSHPTTPPAILAGPAVSETQSEPTIVKRAFDGTLEDIGAEPEAAAIAALHLTAAQREAFDKLLGARHTAFDQAVRENYALVVELGTLQNQESVEARIELLNKARFAFAPFFELGSLADQMQEHLTDEQREQLNQMLNEYRLAKLDSVQRSLGVPRQQAAFRARVEAFGQMIRDSIERQIGLEREQFERLVEELELDQEQQAKAQALFGPIAVKQFQKQDVTAERAKAWREFNRMLTPHQRAKAFALMLREWQALETPATVPNAATMPDGGSR